MRKFSRGFTLVELAIVIVIIGLLVGGVLQGQELITQAKLRSTISKIGSYNTAVATFKAKYNGLPGDLVKAAAFGLNTQKNSTIPNVCATVGYSADPVTTTSGGNGNGNNILQPQNIACNLNTGGLMNPESFRNYSGEISNFFAHLANSQLIKDPINWVDLNVAAAVNVAYPSLPLGEGIGMIALTEGTNTYWVAGVGKEMLSLDYSIGNTISPEQAFTIDSKIDDGNPQTGIVAGVSFYNIVFTIASGSTNTCVFTGDTTYNIQGTHSNKKLCTLRILANA